MNDETPPVTCRSSLNMHPTPIHVALHCALPKDTDTMLAQQMMIVVSAPLCAFFCVRRRKYRAHGRAPCCWQIRPARCAAAAGNVREMDRLVDHRAEGRCQWWGTDARARARPAARPHCAPQAGPRRVPGVRRAAWSGASHAPAGKQLAGRCLALQIPVGRGV